MMSKQLVLQYTVLYTLLYALLNYSADALNSDEKNDQQIFDNQLEALLSNIPSNHGYGSHATINQSNYTILEAKLLQQQFKSDGNPNNGEPPSPSRLSVLSDNIDDDGTGSDYKKSLQLTNSSSQSGFSLSGIQVCKDIRKNFSYLVKLDLSELNIHGPLNIDIILSSSPALSMLNCDTNRITSLGEYRLHKVHTSLETLSVKNNLLTHIQLRSFIHFCPQLTSLNLNNNANLSIDANDITAQTNLVVNCTGCNLSPKARYALDNNAKLLPKSTSEIMFETGAHIIGGLLSCAEGFGAILALEKLIDNKLPLSAAVPVAIALTGICFGGNHLLSKGIQQYCFPARARAALAYTIQYGNTQKEQYLYDDHV